MSTSIVTPLQFDNPDTATFTSCLNVTGLGVRLTVGTPEHELGMVVVIDVVVSVVGIDVDVEVVVGNVLVVDAVVDVDVEVDVLVVEIVGIVVVGIVVAMVDVDVVGIEVDDEVVVGIVVTTVDVDGVVVVDVDVVVDEVVVVVGINSNTPITGSAPTVNVTVHAAALSVNGLIASHVPVLVLNSNGCTSTDGTPHG